MTDRAVQAGFPVVDVVEATVVEAGAGAVIAVVEDGGAVDGPAVLGVDDEQAVASGPRAARAAKAARAVRVVGAVGAVGTVGRDPAGAAGRDERPGAPRSDRSGSRVTRAAR